ncbi:MAG: hypothetical protein ACUZ8I_05350 [Candidatus Scalindua sp.]
MADEEDILEKCDSENIVQMLMDTARSMDVYGRKTQEEAEGIEESCHKQGTKGEEHMLLLLTSADGMKRLAELYWSAAKRYKSAAIKLADGATYDNVLPELNSYNVSLNDQIKSEQEGFKRILSILRN